MQDGVLEVYMQLHQTMAKRNVARRLVWIITILFCSAIIAVGGWNFFLRSTPEKTVSSYLLAKDAGDQEEMRRYLSLDSQKQFDKMHAAPGSRLTEIEDYLAEEIKKSDIQPLEVGKAVINGKTAVVPTYWPTTMRTKSTIPFGLVKEGSLWKIDYRLTHEVTLQYLEKIQQIDGTLHR
jgi:hypothetical protein